MPLATDGDFLRRKLSGYRKGYDGMGRDSMFHRDPTGFHTIPVRNSIILRISYLLTINSFLKQSSGRHRQGDDPRRGGENLLL